MGRPRGQARHLLPTALQHRDRCDAQDHALLRDTHQAARDLRFQQRARDALLHALPRRESSVDSAAAPPHLQAIRRFARKCVQTPRADRSLCRSADSPTSTRCSRCKHTSSPSRSCPPSSQAHCRVQASVNAAISAALQVATSHHPRWLGRSTAPRECRRLPSCAAARPSRSTRRCAHDRQDHRHSPRRCDVEAL